MKILPLLALLPALLFAWDGTTADSLWYTSDKEANAYTISNAEQLAGFAAVVNGGTSFYGKTITLGADIVLNDTAGWKNWSDATTGLNQWTPIDSYFNGNFNGNGKVIIGLYINGTGNNYQGLFSLLNGTISNLGLTGFYVKGENYVGGISGLSEGEIKNSYAIGNVKGSDGVGGISNYGVINSYFAGTVTGSSNVGGITGWGTAVTNSFYDSNLAGNLPNGIPKTTEYMQNSVCDDLQKYPSVQNVINANNNYMGWKCNPGSYPSFSGTKAEPFAIASYFASGTGTYADPYIIMTKKQLENTAFLTSLGYNFENKYIKLGADIVLNDTNARGGWRTWDSTTTNLEQWTPIGSDYNYYFGGNFNGNGKVIIGLYINGTGNNYQGLFGNTKNATISNLGLVGFYAKGGTVGGIIGSARNLQILDTYAIGNVVGGIVGGLIGYTNDFTTIANVYFFGDVKSSAYVGGIVGYVSNNEFTINNAYVKGDITSTSDRAGGIVGYGYGSYKLTIANVYFFGNVTGTGVGGIIGHGQGNEIIITNAYVKGDITGSYSIGGIVGSMQATSYYEYAIINACVIGNITSTSTSGKAGGIVGYAYSSYRFAATNTYFAGDVTGSYLVGGIVGDGYQIYIPSSSFYNSNLASSNSYGIPKTTAEMKNFLTYFEMGWDFNSIWAIDPGVNDGYPFFQNSTYTQNKNKISSVYIPSVVEKYNDGLPIEPVVDITYEGTKLIEGTDYDVLYYNNVKVSDSAKIIILGKGNYYGIKIVNFHIINQKRDIAYTIIEPIFPEPITGDSIKPNPVIRDFNNEVTLREGKDYTLEYANNKYVGQAIIRISGIGVYEGRRNIDFSIVSKIVLTVNWSDEREFVYNKMVQVPKASIDADDIQWRVVNAYSAAGKYTDENKLAPFVQIISANASSYELKNNTVDYEIKKKPLNPYFKVPSTFSNSTADTLWVPSEIFADSIMLRQTLKSFIGYDGFAQDTVTKEKDDASVLKNTPAINITYNPSSQARGMLTKRVETTQTAVAVINTDGVSADNYALSKRSIVIMETTDTEDNGSKVFCRRESYCTELSGTVCSFFGGTPVGSCETKVSCLVENEAGSRCASGLSLEECRGIGGTALIVSCEETTPLKWSPLYSNTFRVWQTASGVVSVDLGYMPAKPVAVQIYDLKGKLIASGEAGTRFASIRLNAGGGVYLFKVGNRSVVKVLK
jgi:hypothetical protein